MGVNDGPLDVVDVSVVFKSSLEKTCLFTEMGNMSTIIMAEHFISKDGIGNLRSAHQVHFKNTGLKMPLIFSVFLENVKKEGCGLLNEAHLLEHIDNLLK